MKERRCFHSGWVASAELVLLLGSFLFFAIRVGAHETDNFYLPLDVEFADLGDFLGAVHTQVIEEAVMEVNAKIERSLATTDPAARSRRLERWHDPDKIAAAVARRFRDSFTETVRAERALSSSWTQRAYPGKQVANHDIWMNFAGHIPIDP